MSLKYITLSVLTLALCACASGVQEKAENYSRLSCDAISDLIRSYDNQSFAAANIERARGTNNGLREDSDRNREKYAGAPSLNENDRETIKALRLAWKANDCG